MVDNGLKSLEKYQYYQNGRMPCVPSQYSPPQSVLLGVLFSTNTPGTYWIILLEALCH